MKKIIFRLSVVIAFILTLLFSFGQELEALQVRAAGSGNGDFQVIFEPLKPIYQVGERIQFRVQGNKPFYLYLFSIDEEHNKGYILLPNALQKNNLYTPHQDHIVPASGVEFFSDSPGTEKVVMLASTQPLDFSLNGYSKSGSFYSNDAGSLKSLVKTLRIRESSPVQKVIGEISLVIIGP